MRYQDQQFENQDIILDGNEYVNCQFKTCTFHYHGGQTWVLDNCVLINPGFLIEGCASFTIGTLATLYEIGFQDVINQILDGIRGGAKPDPKIILH